MYSLYKVSNGILTAFVMARNKQEARKIVPTVIGFSAMSSDPSDHQLSYNFDEEDIRGWSKATVTKLPDNTPQLLGILR